MAVRVSFPQVDVRGLPITVCKTVEVRGIITTAIEARQLCRVATVNLDFLRLADERPEVQQALLDCEHRFADGWPILELARLAGTMLPERVTGADLTPRILSWAREAGWKVGHQPRTKASSSSNAAVAPSLQQEQAGQVSEPSS